MDDLNLFHVLEKAVGDIEHGVQLSSQNDIDSKTLVCFLDGSEHFYYGFCYKNGSNLRVVTWENDAKKHKTVPKGSYVIAFKHESTVKGIKHVFLEEDFIFDWFDQTARANVQKELKSLIDKEDRLEKIVQGLCGLTIQELDEVDKKMEGLKNK